MSQYSIGEVAQQFNITVRTLQYYRKKGLLLPASTTDGQRRMYNEQSLKRLKLILLLKELELSLDDIKKLLNDDQQLKSLKLILQLKKENLEQDMHDAKRTVDTINQLQRMIAQHSTSPIEEFTDIHLMMTKSKQLKSFYRRLWLSAGVIGVIQYTSIVISIIHRSALPFVKVLPLLVIYGIGIVYFYRHYIYYLCPNCHTRFKPGMWSFIKARHTMHTRKLSCPHCHETHYCAEVK